MRLTTLFDVTGMLAGAPATDLNVTSCSTDGKLKLTDPVLLMVTLNGLNELPGMNTVSATGIPKSLTVTPVLPDTPPTAAVTLAWPAAFAVTRPVAVIDATLVGETDQLTAAPLTGFPFASRGTAVNWID